MVYAVPGLTLITVCGGFRAGIPDTCHRPDALFRSDGGELNPARPPGTIPETTPDQLLFVVERWGVHTPAVLRHCCEGMRAQLDHAEDPWDDPDAVVVYTAEFDEYGLPVRDGGTSMVVIGFCPWCGGRLPESRRDAWFDEMERLGLDPWTDEVPEDFRSDAWWRGETAPAGATREHVEPERVVSPV
jgi:hypothetical protein